MAEETLDLRAQPMAPGELLREGPYQGTLGCLEIRLGLERLAFWFAEAR